MDETKAATKIQAISRGKADRKFVEEKKTGALDQPAVPETDDDVPVAPEWPPYCNPNYEMPNKISVEVRQPRELGGGTVTFDVEIEKSTTNKPYVGGYRHKKTGYIYHHGSSQTSEGMDVRKGWRNPESKCHRDTQTYETKTRSQMTTREYGTQMKRKDLYMDDSGDRVVVSRPYFSSQQALELKREKTLVIQCYYRGYVARKRTWAIREALYLDHLSAKEEADKAREADEKRRQHEIQRRQNPRTAQDFALLFNELEAWKEKEKNSINNNTDLSETERKAAMMDLLAKQTKALQSIDRLKVTAQSHGKKKKVDSMLRLMSTPKQWELGSGEVQEVHNQFTNRAAELREIYAMLNAAPKGIDDRLETLVSVKWTAGEFDCALTRDITELCDREAEMLNRGRSEATLAGLRKRLSNLFLQFMEHPEFNPEATRFLKVPLKHLASHTDPKNLMSQTA